MRKQWLVVISAGILLSVGGMMSSLASEDNGQEQSTPINLMEATKEWQWKEDSGGWRYIKKDETYKKNCWEKIDGNWYYFGFDGYMSTDWTTIRGMDYLFAETGELQLGWCYNDEEEKWHYYKEDGTPQKGWFQDLDGSWYWFSAKGEMTSSGYKYVTGGKYYFFDNGQMAANQYVGLFYMDETGNRNKNFDIIIESKKKNTAVSAEVKEGFTEASKNLPREWVKRFTDQGWEILYYPEKQYFSAPNTGSGVYYVGHSLDTTYKKIKICNPSELTEAFCEYIGYEYGLYKGTLQEATDLSMDKSLMDEYVFIPDYYADDMKFYFGKLAAAYLGSASTRSEMEAEAPEVTRILKKILYRQS